MECFVAGPEQFLFIDDLFQWLREYLGAQKVFVYSCVVRRQV